MRLKGIFFMAAALLLSSSCIRHELDPRFIESDEIRLIMSGKEIFTYDPLSCQMAYNNSRHEFRAFTDNMSDYFTLRLSSFPSTLNQEVSGEIIWNTEKGSGTLNNTAFKAVRLEGGKLWLWNATAGIAVVVSYL
ncbi:MAG: hypothetical protein MJY46_00245 [Bacteroidales bacterium]|nr:hypothetical protein [Bacteroidales bacterium]